MKKHLFLIASVFAAVSLQAQAVVNVASDTGVKVKPNTLFYVGGDVKVADYADNSSKTVSNEGKIKITGRLVNENQKNGQEDGSNFVNEFPEAGQYGQLIVNSAGDANVGKIKTIVRLNKNFVYHSLAIPYEDLTAIDVVKQLYPGRETDVENSFVGYRFKNSSKKYFDRNRKKNPLFTWDNTDHYLRHLGKAEEIVPTSYYAINKGSALGAFEVEAESSIQGQPAKKEYTVNLTQYKISNSLDSNPVGEYYGSYIFDYTESIPAGWTDYKRAKPGVEAGTFGSNIFDLANPYTSNIDLSKIPGDFLSKVKTLVQYTSETYNEAVNSGGDSDAYGVTSFNAYVPGQSTGDVQLGFVRPFQTFSVKMNDDFGSATLTFNDKVKTFEAKDNTPNILYTSSRGVKASEVNQVGLDVVNTKGNLVGKTYVVASDIYEAAQQGQGTEVYNVALDDESVGVYTLQENEDGTVNEALSESKSYINGVNADKYIAKPIHVVFQNGKGKYTLKARLNESLENNKNAFYFEDKSTGKVQKITKDFEYTFNVNGTEKDRFVLYWAATPNKEKVEEVAKQEVSTTVVFKDADTYKVRFDKGIKKADVFVYNISGQLVNTARNVDASVDYIVPLRGNSSVYIVKVIGDNGQVITKKIIK